LAPEVSSYLRLGIAYETLGKISHVLVNGFSFNIATLALSYAWFERATNAQALANTRLRQKQA